MQSNPLAFNNIPDKFKTNEELIKLAIELDGSNFTRIYSFMQTKELARIALKICGLVIRSIDKKWIDTDIYRETVEVSPQALEYVPIQLIPELALIAVKNDSGIIRSLPDRYKTLEICKIAYATDPTTSNFFPHQILQEHPEFEHVLNTSSPYNDQIITLTNALDCWKESLVKTNQTFNP